MLGRKIEREVDEVLEKPKSVKKGKVYPNADLARIVLRSKEAVRDWDNLQSIMIVRGEDVSAAFESWVATLCSVGMELIKGKEIVPASQLIGTAEAMFGVGFSNYEILLLKNEKWTLGVEYWSAPNGKTMSYRYDAELCLPELEKLAARKKGYEE